MERRFVNSHFKRKQGHFSETEDLKKGSFKKKFPISIRNNTPKTADRNSHCIGNRERKQTLHSYLKKAMDSRKTLTDCGFSLSSEQTESYRDGYEKWEKCFRTAACFFYNGKSQKSEKRLFPFEMEMRFCNSHCIGNRGNFR